MDYALPVCLIDTVNLVPVKIRRYLFITHKSSYSTHSITNVHAYLVINNVVCCGNQLLSQHNNCIPTNGRFHAYVCVDIYFLGGCLSSSLPLPPFLPIIPLLFSIIFSQQGYSVTWTEDVKVSPEVN